MLDTEDFELPANIQKADAVIDARRLRGDAHHVAVNTDDLAELNNTQQSDFINKIADCNLMQENINKLFPQATTIDSVLRLVAGGITMHRHRSAIINEYMPPKTKERKDDVEYDSMGNVIVSKR